MIRVVCGCGRLFKAEDRHAGKRTKCPVCGMMLTIGGTPVPSSSGGDFDEVPSWWYPTDPERPAAPGEMAGGVGDAESQRTAVFPPTTDPGRANGLGSPLRASIPANGKRLSASAPPSSRARRLWGLSAGSAALAVLALGFVAWMWSVTPQEVGVPRGAWVTSGRSRDPAPGPSQTAPGRTGGSSVVPRDAQVHEDSGGDPPASMARRLRLLVPAYIYPNKEGLAAWQRLIAAASKVDVVAVANPDSGPGSTSNPDYVSIIAKAVGAGVKVVGYVNTEYGKRDLAEVQKDIDAWIRFYPKIAGFFLDQQACQGRYAAYYAELRNYARSRLPDPFVITNPGSPCDKTFFARRASDVTCVFSSYKDFGTFELPADFKVYDPSRFAALIYKVADVAAMREMVEDAIIKKIGYIYITDSASDKPWEKLPSYWDDEVDAIARVH